jgi:RNA polymerase sigma-70 factor (ECF subfamily)
VDKILQGDENAFRKLFESFFVPLCNFVKHYIPSHDIAQDLAQEALLKYWQRREHFNNFNQVRTFLYRSVRNMAFNELEHLKVVNKVHTRMLTEPLPSPGESDTLLVEEEVFRQLRTAIETLPKRSREIMQMSLRQITNEEIADTLGISRKTVRSLKKIAYKKLKVRLSR